jgi:hypothetical protein
MSGLPLQEGLSAPARVVKAYLEAENVEGGLLEDVKSIIPTIKSDQTLDTPGVWIHEHPTFVEDGKSINLSHTQFMVTIFEFVCVEYDDDPEQAAYKAKNLATRVGASIINNFNEVKSQPDDPDHMFQLVRFSQLIPDGRIEIPGKNDSVPVAAIIFEFVYPISWMHCTKL